ncbi:MAG: hypothetical protein EU532_03185 [Promethearchaeota archaeon]|nr:MAG: hypothetical protein EU532_03185 [Candidatus Lokiarchaeota archaeon]
MNEDYLERNYRIVQDKMIEEMDLALDFGKKLVDSELDAGIFDFLIKPIVKSFYNYWSVHDARTGTLEQIKIALDCGKYLVKNGMNQENFDNLIAENFPKYFTNDQIYRQCKKNHKNFKELKKVTRETFIIQVKETVTFLKINDEVNNYDDLVRAAFKTKQEAYQSLIRQLDLNDNCIKIVEKDSAILKIPTGKHIILKVLRKGFIQTKKYLLDGLDEIYG